jgi:hypothetical protein
MQAAEGVGIRDLAYGEFLPGDTTLEEGIERQINYLLDQVGCNRPGFSCSKSVAGTVGCCGWRGTAAPKR